ncbi:hypothetical protein [Clostridium estertheticum]|uniref:Uncharacterized protein n=1 Tax=Clostridium estertheticum subsp. estertheticum TaxID=1552 RepID=A0A1J0GJM4_9CLOT|nr:hypothetical protein [Clostridium estertheticum]APC41537.1 hypothetical protein A7L45_16360 [Clostridium estertheticum subsp. estertheticum]
MSKSIVYQCLKCDKEHRLDAWDKVLGNMRCECGGILALKGKQTSTIAKGITVDIGVEFKGYDKAKQQLRNLEATCDRILEKQEKIGKTKVDEGITINNGGVLKIGGSYGARTEAITKCIVKPNAKEFSINGKTMNVLCCNMPAQLQPKKRKTIFVEIDGEIRTATVDDRVFYNR